MFHQTMFLLFETLHTTPRRRISLTQAVFLSSTYQQFLCYYCCANCNNMRPLVKSITHPNGPLGKHVLSSAGSKQNVSPNNVFFYLKLCIQHPEGVSLWHKLFFCHLPTSNFFATIAVLIANPNGPVLGNTCFLQQVQKVTSVGCSN